MKIIKHLSVVIVVLLIGCGLWSISGCRIYTEISITSDETVDFSKYKTFAWLQDNMDTANTPYNNEIIRNNIRNYFGQCFAERGFSVNLDTPDVLLQIVIVNKKREKNVYYPAYPKPYYYCPYYYCSPYYSPYSFDYYYRYPGKYCYAMGYCKETIQYIEGSITLNVIDRAQNKLIWSGTARGDIYDPEYINENIHPAVKAIMKKFPLEPISIKQKYSTADDAYTISNSAYK